jgi:hypothetical protein
MLPNNPSQVNPAQWNSVIRGLYGVHILQTWEWGKVKSQFGWQPNFLLWFQEDDLYTLSTNHFPSKLYKKQLVAAALTLQRNIRIGGFSNKMGVIYVPKGPLLDWILFCVTTC